VSAFLAVTVLMLAAATLFMLPLIPALWELHRKSDALPLSVIQQHAGEIRFFADGFRSYIKELEPALRDCVSSGAAATGTLPGGTEYLVLGRGDDALHLPLKERDELCPVLIAASTDLLLPSDTTFSKDIYAGGRFIGGTKNRYRAILGEKEVHLSNESSVMRWVHAVGEFRADQGCKLYGRISSDRGIHLQRDCSFQRLNAPWVEIGQAGNNPVPLAEDSTVPESGSPQRLLHDGDFEIPAGEIFRGNLVVRGSLWIGPGARVYGSVKGDKDVILESGVSVKGSLIASSQMRIGSNCRIHGPVIAEHLMLIETGTRCGTPEVQTTVSAPWIEVEEGVVIFGTLWAREHGQVVAYL